MPAQPIAITFVAALNYTVDVWTVMDRPSGLTLSSCTPASCFHISWTVRMPRLSKRPRYSFEILFRSNKQDNSRCILFSVDYVGCTLWNLPGMKASTGWQRARCRISCTIETLQSSRCAGKRRVDFPTASMEPSRRKTTSPSSLVLSL